MLAGQLLQALQVSLVRRNHAHIRHHAFGDHRRDLSGVVLDGTLQRNKIIPGNDDRVIQGVAVKARTVGNHDRIAAQPHRRRWQRVRSYQNIVVPAVIVPLEFQDLRSSGAGACEPHYRHHRFRSRVRESDNLGIGHNLLQQFGDFKFNLGCGREMSAAGSAFSDRLSHLRIRMPQRQRAESHHPVDVFVSIHIV